MVESVAADSSCGVVSYMQSAQSVLPQSES